MTDLKQKRQKIEDLERKLQESESMRLRMESSMSAEEKDMKMKFINYEKNLEQLTIMYHQLASQKSLMNKD